MTRDDVLQIEAVGNNVLVGACPVAAHDAGQDISSNLLGCLRRSPIEEIPVNSSADSSLLHECTHSHVSSIATRWVFHTIF